MGHQISPRVNHVHPISLNRTLHCISLAVLPYLYGLQRTAQMPDWLALLQQRSQAAAALQRAELQRGTAFCAQQVCDVPPLQKNIVIGVG